MLLSKLLRRLGLLTLGWDGGAHGWPGNRGGGGAATLPLSQARAHEVRAGSITLAAASSVRLDDIIQATFWESSSVFTDFFLRDVTDIRLDGLHSLSAVVATGRSCRL